MTTPTTRRIVPARSPRRRLRSSTRRFPRVLKVALPAAACLLVPMLLLGTGPGTIDVTPTTLDVGVVEVGDSARSSAITITETTNVGTFTVSGITVSGTNKSDFEVLTNSCVTFISAGTSCTFKVKFTPGDVGTRTARVTVASDATPVTNNKVTLTGAGTDSTQAPSEAGLTSPADGETGVSTSPTFKWKESDDPQGDDVTYTFYICDDDSFADCSGEAVAMLARKSVLAYGGALGGAALLLIGIVVPGARSRRGLLLLALIAALGTTMILAACASSGGGGKAKVSHEVTGLDSSTTYYWKVRSADSSGNAADSATYSFITE